MEYQGKIVVRVYPEGPTGEPDSSGRPVALLGMTYDCDQNSAIRLAIKVLESMLPVERLET